MGVYNTYGKQEIQLKVADELRCEHFEEGKLCDVNDGIYFGHEGVVIVVENRVAITLPKIDLYDKWGKPVKWPTD